MRRASDSHIPELDGVRGLAVAMVVVCHLFGGKLGLFGGKLGPGLLPLLAMIPIRAMWTGVDLFFVLSGCLIGGILIDNRAADNFYPVFYARRALRIFPLYFAWIAIFLAATAALAPPEGPVSVLSNTFSRALPAWSYLTFTQNFCAAWRNKWGGAWAAPTWSLAVEEQFYLTLPFLVRNLSRKTLVRAAAAAVAVTPIVRLLLYLGVSPLAATVLLLGRVDEFSVGILVAVAVRDARVSYWLREHRRWLLAAMLSIAAVLGYSALTDFSNQAFMYIVLLGLLGIFYAIILTDILVMRPPWVGIFRSPALRKLGVIAYGVYIMHQGLNDLAHIMIRGSLPQASTPESLLVTVMALAITLALAGASWRFFESPLTDWGHRRFRYSFAGSRIADQRTPAVSHASAV